VGPHPHDGERGSGNSLCDEEVEDANRAREFRIHEKQSSANKEIVILRGEPKKLGGKVHLRRGESSSQNEQLERSATGVS